MGQTITLNGRVSTIIGVVQSEFQLPEAPAQVYQPLGISRETLTSRSGHYLSIVGRAKPNVSLERIRTEMATVTSRWTAEYDHAHPLDAEPLRHEVLGDSSFALLVVLFAVAAVLLIACANVAGLMLTRAVSRQREMAIRTAIGATRRDLARQLLIEGLVLALAGGALGLLVATAALPMLLRLEPGDLPRLGEVHINGTVIAFTMALSALCGVIFTLVPALRVSSLDPNKALAGTSGASADASRQRFLRGIVTAEIALALVLVVGAGLLTQSFGRMLQVDPGLQSDGVLTTRVSLPASSYSTPEEIRQFYDSLHRELLELPEVVAAGGVRRLPLRESAFMEVFMKEDEFGRDDDLAGRRFEYQMVTPDYFDTMGVGIVAGRVFDTDDRPDSPRVAIINEALAARHFAGEDPVGQSIYILASDPRTEPFRIVGVARDVLQDAHANIAGVVLNNASQVLPYYYDYKYYGYQDKK